MRGAGKAPTGAFVGIAGCIAKASKWAIPGVMGVDGIDGKGGGIIGNMGGTGKMGCVDPIPGACIFGLTSEQRNSIHRMKKTQLFGVIT